MVVTVGQDQPIALSQHWGDWLKTFEWEAWGTMTLRYADPTHEQMQRAWSRFVATLRREGERDLSFFVGHEVGAQGRIHLHCLLAGLQLKRTSVWRWWHERYGRCEVKGYDPEKGAAHYISKYVTKELAHYDLDLRGFKCLEQSPSSGSPTWKRTRKPTA